MDKSRSILSPLGAKAKHLSDAAMQQLADIDTAAIRTHIAQTAKHIAGSARDAAVAASDVAAPYLHKMAVMSQQQLQNLGDTLEANARSVAKRWNGKRNMVTRHPIAATMLAGSLGYLAVLAWRRSHAQATVAKTRANSRKRTKAGTKAGTKVGTKTDGAVRPKASHARRATRTRAH